MKHNFEYKLLFSNFSFLQISLYMIFLITLHDTAIVCLVKTIDFIELDVFETKREILNTLAIKMSVIIKIYWMFINKGDGRLYVSS